MTAARAPKILVVGINFVMTWRVVVSLRAAGFRPSVLSMNNAVSPAGLLVGGGKQLSFPRGMRVYDGTAFSAEARRALAEMADDFDVIVPADMDATEACARLPSLAQRCLVSSPEILNAVHNKWNFTQHLTGLGIPVPASSTLIPDRTALARFTPRRPTVVKPLDASAGQGVVFISNHMDAGKLAHDPKTVFPLLAQDVVPGWDLGISVLARKGRLLAANVWERPVEGARDFLGADSALAQRLLLDAARVLASFHFTGVGHFDAMRALGTDNHAFLEFNPRYWGSMLYSNAYGTNFTALNVHQVLWPDAPLDLAPQVERRVSLARHDQLLQRLIPSFEGFVARAESAPAFMGRFRLGLRPG